MGGPAAKEENDGEEEQADDGNNLDARKHEFGLSVALDDWGLLVLQSARAGVIIGTDARVSASGGGLDYIYYDYNYRIC